LQLHTQAFPRTPASVCRLQYYKRQTLGGQRLGTLSKLCWKVLMHKLEFLSNYRMVSQ